MPRVEVIALEKARPGAVRRQREAGPGQPHVLPRQAAGHRGELGGAPPSPCPWRRASTSWALAGTCRCRPDAVPSPQPAPATPERRGPGSSSGTATIGKTAPHSRGRKIRVPRRSGRNFGSYASWQVPVLLRGFTSAGATRQLGNRPRGTQLPCYIEGFLGSLT